MNALAADPMPSQAPPSPPLGDAPEVRRFEPSMPDVRHQRMLRMQGYADMERVRPAITSAAREMAELAMVLNQPAVAYRYLRVLGLDRLGVEAVGGGRLSCGAFQSRLGGCTEIVPFVLSCGQAIGQAVVDLADKGDLLEAVLLETAGWLCIEDATRQFKDVLRQEASARACRITSRMGPGYSYRVGEDEMIWPLEDQVEFFRLFGDVELPVSLMSSCAMNPKLSRSGLYGVAPLHKQALQATRPGSLN